MKIIGMKKICLLLVGNTLLLLGSKAASHWLMATNDTRAYVIGQRLPALPHSAIVFQVIKLTIKRLEIQCSASVFQRFDTSS